MDIKLINSIINSNNETEFKGVINNLDLNEIHPDDGVTVSWLFALHKKWALLKAAIDQNKDIDWNAAPQNPTHTNYGSTVLWVLALNGQWTLLEAIITKYSDLDWHAAPQNRHNIATLLLKEKKLSLLNQVLPHSLDEEEKWSIDIKAKVLSNFITFCSDEDFSPTEDFSCLLKLSLRSTSDFNPFSSLNPQTLESFLIFAYDSGKLEEVKNKYNVTWGTEDFICFFSIKSNTIPLESLCTQQKPSKAAEEKLLEKLQFEQLRCLHTHETFQIVLAEKMHRKNEVIQTLERKIKSLEKQLQTIDIEEDNRSLSTKDAQLSSFSYSAQVTLLGSSKQEPTEALILADKSRKFQG
jgi:hypothetical protein